jgi:hypothetical protein
MQKIGKKYSNTCTCTDLQFVQLKVSDGVLTQLGKESYPRKVEIEGEINFLFRVGNCCENKINVTEKI